jgi:hypothetical protein
MAHPSVPGIPQGVKGVPADRWEWETNEFHLKTVTTCYRFDALPQREAGERLRHGVRTMEGQDIPGHYPFSPENPHKIPRKSASFFLERVLSWYACSR